MSTNRVPYRIHLSERNCPSWYNIRADLPNLSPYLNPKTKEPVVPDDMKAIFLCH